MSIANNNPGNLRFASIGWQGEISHDQHGFSVFDTAANGLRALAVDLRNQQLLHGLHTIGDIIPKYAPAADANNVAAYIADVSKTTGYAPGQELDLTDPATLHTLMAAVIRHENGAQPYTLMQIATAVDAALMTPQGKAAAAVPPQAGKDAMMDTQEHEPVETHEQPIIINRSNPVQNTATAVSATAVVVSAIDYIVTALHLPAMSTTLESGIAAGLILLAHVLYDRYGAK